MAINTIKFLDEFIGYPLIDSQFTPAAATPGLFPFTPGEYAQAESYDFGGGEFIYARASAGIRLFGLCMFLPVFDTTLKAYRWDALEVTNTANLARQVGVAMSNTALTTGQYGWFAISGVVPMSAQASVAAGTSIGIGGAGQVGAVAAGKQILNAVSAAASAATIVKAGATGDNGSFRINVPDTQGLFVGAALSGTGVGAGVITFLSPDGTFLLNSVANTAAIVGTSVTVTFTGYIMAHINRPFAQGAIT
jgi:hypothetical protein